MTSASGPPLAVVYDVDGSLPLAPLGRQFRRLRGLLAHAIGDRRSVLGMAGLLRGLSASAPDSSLHYLSALPRAARRPLTALLRHDGHLPAPLHLAGRRTVPDLWTRANRARRAAVLDRLLAAEPARTWVLIGDDGGDDPRLFDELDRRHPGRVGAIALRTVTPAGSDREGALPGVVPVVRAPNAEELLPLLRHALGLHRPAGRGPQDWLLSGAERGNDATELRAFTTGNAVRALHHGRTYFPVLAGELDAAGAEDQVLLIGWRGDADQRLDGRSLGEVLQGAAGRGAAVRGLLWRSHASELGYSARENRRLATALRAAGGQLLLDMRIRSRGSHHQKMVVVRHGRSSERDVAYVGGIDLAHSRGDDCAHHGDPQTTPFATAYGPTAAWHDVQLELRGPAVRDAELVFAERWHDPAALVRLPWHVVPDRLHGLDRTAAPLPEPDPDPPAAGSCAVQLLRTYPRRRPAYPFAPHGERSIARGYAKALDRAQRLVYIEDQYLWSVDVARVFATALQRAPRLQLIAVVPRLPDSDGPLYRMSAHRGRAEALAMVHEAGGDRVQVFDVENRAGRPIYVHAKVCVIDDVWAAVGSDNFNVRSWTHDSELTAAVVDERRDDRHPLDPGGLGDGARHFARELRLDLMREHLECDHLECDDDAALLDPDAAASAFRASAAALDAWHTGAGGPRPAGRLRRYPRPAPAADRPHWRRFVADPLYRAVLDPDGRPLTMRLRRTY